MKDNVEKLGLESTVDTYKVGDHLFTVDFVSEDGNCHYDVTEFEIKSIAHDRTKPDNPIVSFDIVDVRYPKVNIKNDLKSGFFRTPEEGKKAFFEYIEYVYNEAKKLND